MTQSATPQGGSGGSTSGGSAPLDRKLCQVVGTNQNFTSSSGTLYHIQVEDRGPVMDAVSETEVRRVNVIVYVNYGEPSARIIHGRDHDLPDIRTQDHNRFVSQKIQELAQEARAIVEEKEQRQVARIKALIREYYVTKDEAVKKQFEEANTLFPFLFSRAWRELKAEKAQAAAAPAQPQAAPVAEAPSPAPAAAAPPPAAAAQPPVPAGEEELEELPLEDVLYPLDAELREKVIDIERIIIELGHDLKQLKDRGKADDILLQTCRKLVARAKDSLSGREPSEFNARRLDMTRNSLMQTWRQVKSRLSRR